jgi:hypothetical protein
LKVKEHVKKALIVFGCILGLAVDFWALPVICRAQQAPNFSRDVRPILSDRCFQCHGPNEQDREAELRLDQANGPDGAYRTLDESAAIKPGSSAESALWQRITSTDDDRMPPPDSSKKPLTAGEQEIIKQWIDAGAAYADFWAFVPPRTPALPEVESQRWNQQPIDRLVMRSLNAAGLSPNPTAERRTLIRRLSLDLIGLPPTREEIHSYLTDTEPGAYERLVDRLLAKPQYGEHMTKYWLDLVRFADTNGIHHDHYREMTPYRDWVIRAFNQNLSYDQFVKFQLAGDLYPEPTRDQLIASGFNRLHLIIDVGTALPEESYARNVVDRVTAVGTAFMGLTVQCAVCHDHKYDPITTKEFYQLFAFFNNLDGAAETGGRQGTDFQRGLQPPYISLASETQQAQLEKLNHRVEEVIRQVQQIELRLSKVADEGQKNALQAELKLAQQDLEKAQTEKQTHEATIPIAMVMKEKADRRPAHIMLRGAYDNLGAQVKRDTPAFLPPIQKDGEKTRLDLAKWFVSAENPLTARVAVNRIWQQIFAVGIVKTSEDFGAQGDWPSHPELLDYLAVAFIESGWDVKGLIKQIVMSETYRQTSTATPDQFENDPENRLLSRGSRFRIDSEMIRDQVLATSGLLNYTLYGKSVKPPQPAGLWESVSMPSSYPRSYEADTGDKIYRRSLYTFWKRGMPPPQMSILNAPSREACITRRERTNTPLQALLLLNEPEYLRAARHLAHETIADRSLSPATRLAVIYETITSKLPNAEETEVFLKMVEDLAEIYRDNPKLAGQLCDGVELSEGESAVELASWTMLINTIYNLDITKMRG